MTKTVTKAERIFNSTWYECLDHAKSWGREYNPDGRAIGYGSLVTEEVVCTRTLNDVQKCIDRRKRELDLNEKYGMYDCSGRAFSCWAKSFRRRGAWWFYHSVAFDV